LTYKPAGEVKRKVAVVGKGLTFDSGGYNIKAGPGSMIEMMKVSTSPICMYVFFTCM
jgi:leucyl aminopeptidase